MGESSYRVSDAEREQTVMFLREHLLEGRLTLEEFSERVELTLRASVGGDLELVQEGLPQLTSPSQALVPQPAVTLQPASNRKPVRLTAAVFGHVVRRGRLRLRRGTVLVGVFADIDFDLREATIERAQTAVSIFVVFGNADVYVPEGVNVEVGGLTIFGHRRDWGHDVARPDAPTVRVRALGLFGTIDVWRVPHNMRGSYSDVIRKVRKRQHGARALRGKSSRALPP